MDLYPSPQADRHGNYSATFSGRATVDASSDDSVSHRILHTHDGLPGSVVLTRKRSN